MELDKNERMRKGRTMSLLIILIVIIAFLCVYLFYREDKFKMIAQNQYNKAFYELINYTENVESMLAKSMVTTSPEHSVHNLVDIWREANLAQGAISLMPVSTNLLEDANRFLNQVSDYSYSLSKVCVYGQDITDEQMSNLKTLYEQSATMQDQLLELSDNMTAGSFTWDKLTNTGNKIINQDYESVKVDFIDNVNNDLQNYSGLIYDGAFSDHVTQSNPKGVTGQDISEEDAKGLIEKFVDKSNIKEIKSNGLQEGDIPVYNFSVLLNDEKNEDNYMVLSITRKGGHLFYLLYDKHYGEKMIEVDEAKKKGKEYLQKIGYENMEPTYHIIEGNSVIINYASKIENVIMYPDLIKVKIGLDNGEVTGLEAKGYLNNHHDRDISAKITNDEAREKINKNVNIENEELSIIPTDWKTEILCYEFKGKIEDKTFLIYINAETGNEEKIYLIINDENGILTI